MKATNKTNITIEARIKATIEKVWEHWTDPMHITKWNNASDDWHTPHAENDLKVGGKFLYRMEAKDGSFGFDFVGVYDEVTKYKLIAYTMGDGRKARINFEENGNETQITTIFEAENKNPIEMQKSGWQAILNNFKKHIESFS